MHLRAVELVCLPPGAACKTGPSATPGADRSPSTVTRRHHQHYARADYYSPALGALQLLNNGFQPPVHAALISGYAGP